MGTIIGVAIAGALGAIARYGLGGVIAARFPTAFPWDTLLINVTGSFALGLLFVVLTERLNAAPALRAAITIGFLGAYTTFSTFSLETVRLLEDGSYALALLNVGSSVALGLGAAGLGVAMGRAI